jgi:hypothetical protein
MLEAIDITMVVILGISREMSAMKGVLQNGKRGPGRQTTLCVEADNQISGLSSDATGVITTLSALQEENTGSRTFNSQRRATGSRTMIDLAAEMHDAAERDLVLENQVAEPFEVGLQAINAQVDTEMQSAVDSFGLDRMHDDQAIARAVAHEDEMDALGTALSAAEFRADQAECRLVHTMEQLRICTLACEAARTEAEEARAEGQSRAANALIASQRLQNRVAVAAEINMANLKVLMEHVAGALIEAMALEQMQRRLHMELDNAKMEGTELRRWQCAAQSQVSFLLSNPFTLIITCCISIRPCCLVIQLC